MSAIQACLNCGQPLPTGVAACPLCGQDLPSSDAREQKSWRIACPNGHVSVVTEQLLDTVAVCPKCDEEFVVRIADTLEQRDAERQRQEQRDAEAAQRWLKWAIWAGVAFGVLIATLVVMSILGR